MWKRVAVSAFAIVHPIKLRRLLENFLPGFSCPGEGGFRVARGGSLLATIPTCA